MNYAPDLKPWRTDEADGMMVEWDVGVRVRRVESGILLEPMVNDIEAWFAELDKFSGVPFMEDGCRQPRMPQAEGMFA